MYCSKCGVKNQDGAKFCKECGHPFHSEKENNIITTGKPKKSKIIYFLIGGIVLFLAIIAALLIGMQTKKTKEYESYLDTAQKYVAELDYEQAKDYYLKAIEVEPQKLEPYVKLAEVYMEQGETEMAMGILQKAEEQGAKAESEEIIKIKEGITTNISTYQMYADMIYKYEQEYGTAEMKEEDSWLTYLTGLCFMKLVDFDHNGQEELLLVFAEEVINFDFSFATYRFEIWGVENQELLLLEEGDYLFGTTDGSSVYLATFEGKTYLVTGGEDSYAEYNYYGYLNDSDFGIVRSEKYEDDYDMELITIDGQEVSYDEFEREHEKRFKDLVEYRLSHYDNCSKTLEQNKETKQRLSIQH